MAKIHRVDLPQEDPPHADRQNVDHRVEGRRAFAEPGLGRDGQRAIRQVARAVVQVDAQVWSPHVPVLGARRDLAV